jgi:hypothetical protein
LAICSACLRRPQDEGGDADAASTADQHQLDGGRVTEKARCDRRYASEDDFQVSGNQVI